MPTNPIPANTANFPTNLHRDLHRALGRLAYESNMSAGAFVRTLIAEAVLTKRHYCKDASARLVEHATNIAKTSAKASAILLTILGFGAVAGGSLTAFDQDMIRTRVSIRVSVRREREVA